MERMGRIRVSGRGAFFAWRGRMTDASGNAVQFEASDAAPRLIGWLAAGIAAFLVLTPLALRLCYPESMHRPVRSDQIAAIPPPQLQIDPAGDLATFRAAERQRLSSYGWVDRSRGVVRIPLEHALSLTLERGLPGWQKD